MSRSPSAPPARRGRPPMTADLRLLLRLTVASFALAVLGSLVGLLAAPERSAAAKGIPGLGAGFAALSMLLGIGFTAALYALVYFPLREQQQWAWIVGIVFAAMAVLGAVLNVVLSLAVPLVQTGVQPLLLLPAALKAAVDVAWLVVAARPGVRAALR